VNPDQRPLAIGKNGQNVRLASELTEWEIDIMDISELDDKEAEKVKEEKAKEMTVDDLELDDSVVNKLKDANLTLVQQLQGLSEKDIASVEGIDEEEAKSIVEAVKNIK
jgi:N utilization substance protein A